MRLPLIAATLLFSTAPVAVADDASDACEKADAIARTIMTARQEGVPARDVLKVLAENAPSLSQKLARAMVMAAYDEPRYSTDNMKSRAIDDYANTVFVACMKSF